MTDLFDLAAPPEAAARPSEPPRPAAPEIYPPPPNMAWARRLTGAGPIETLIQVYIHWPGYVLECLSLGEAGRWCLTADDKVLEIKADPGARSRTVYRTATDVWELHPKRPLILVSGGTHCHTYRFARPGEAAPAVLPLPDGGNLAEARS